MGVVVGEDDVVRAVGAAARKGRPHGLIFVAAAQPGDRPRGLFVTQLQFVLGQI